MTWSSNFVVWPILFQVVELYEHVFVEQTRAVLRLQFEIDDSVAIEVDPLHLPLVRQPVEIHVHLAFLESVTVNR